MSRVKSSAVALAALAIVLALGGCRNSSTPAPTPAPPSGPTLVVVVTAPQPPAEKPVYFIGVDVAAVPLPPGATAPLPLVASLLKDSYHAVIKSTSTQGFVGVVAQMDPADADRLRSAGLPYVKYVYRDTVAHADTGCDPAPEGTSCSGQGAWGRDRMRQKGWPTQAGRPCSFDGSGVDVYVIDSGIETTHPEFGGRTFPEGRSFIGGDPNTDPVGHGTQVAGLIAGDTVGMAPGVTLHSVQALSRLPEDGLLGASGDILHKALAATHSAARPEGLPSDWRTAKRVVVVACWNFDEVHPSIDEDVEAMIQDGIVVVAAAGNLRPGVVIQNPSPATAAGGIGIGALDACDQPWLDNVFGPHVMGFAPGVQLLTATRNGAYTMMTGTSAAAPLVAGAHAELMDRMLRAPPDLARKAMIRDAACLESPLIGESAPRRLMDSACINMRLIAIGPR